jgi:hypothetical protein
MNTRFFYESFIEKFAIVKRLGNFNLTAGGYEDKYRFVVFDLTAQNAVELCEAIPGFLIKLY